MCLQNGEFIRNCNKVFLDVYSRRMSNEGKEQKDDSKSQENMTTKDHILRNYGKDVASIQNGTHVSKGCHYPNRMLREDWREYDGSNGYTYAANNQIIQINFRMAYIINTLKFLLWDKDDRHYNYKIEISKDSQVWTTLCDSTQKKSWQEMQIKETQIKHIRLIGTGGNGNHQQLHIVKFMAYFDYSR